jgi:ATP-dependent protease HslVU (ClpYQ) peptidase subunit
MTTIVAMRSQCLMASDSMSTTDTGRFRSRKILRVNGGLIGIAGYLSDITTFLEWHAKRRRRRPRLRGLEALELTQDGRLVYYQSDCSQDEIQDDWWAIGSGAQAALAAMHLLADPVRAIEVACAIDPWSGLPCVVEVLDAKT